MGRPRRSTAIKKGKPDNSEHRRRRKARRRLSERDHRWACAVFAYRDRRFPAAEDLFGASLLEAFRSFCDLWVSRYTWDDPESLDAYRILSHVERRELYRRFAKECCLWEATFRLQLPSDNLPVATRDAPRGREGGSSWRRRIHDLEERESRRRAFYDRLAESAALHAQAAHLPPGVRDAFLLLGLPAGAPLAEVRRTFRRLALSHHPDRDGDHEHMARLNRAYREILEHLDRAPRSR